MRSCHANTPTPCPQLTMSTVSRFHRVAINAFPCQGLAKGIRSPRRMSFAALTKPQRNRCNFPRFLAKQLSTLLSNNDFAVATAALMVTVMFACREQLIVPHHQWQKDKETHFLHSDGDGGNVRIVSAVVGVVDEAVAAGETNGRRIDERAI